MILSFSIERLCAESPDFGEVLNLRKVAYGRAEAGEREDEDDYSLHFIARSADGIVGALRVTCRKDGPLESEIHYPRWLLEEFGNTLCAASRMCVRPDIAGRSSVPLELMSLGWKTVVPLGIRLGVSKVRLNAVPFYIRTGALLIRDTVFQFDKWDALCALVAQPVNAGVPSRFAALFEQVPDPCALVASPHWAMFTRSHQESLATAVQKQVELNETSC